MHQENRVTFSSGNLLLEGVFSLPEGSGPFPGVVVCHPHPRGGGEMDNNVVLAVFHALAQRSIAVLRFNFRGVGGSQGRYDEGIGEQDDARAAVQFLITQPGIDPSRIGLAGYSFGARIALLVGSQDERVKTLASISGTTAINDPALMGCTKPKLFITGDIDTFIPVEQFKTLVDGLPSPTEARIFHGADHFWWGVEADLAKAVATFFVKHL